MHEEKQIWCTFYKNQDIFILKRKTPNAQKIVIKHVKNIQNV